LTTFNATFIALIHKSNNLASFGEFKTISLCNFIYKIIAKIIARRVKKLLSKLVLGEKCGFLEGRWIHDSIGVALEDLRSTKSRNIKVLVVKINFSKAYERVG
jgi:hypothetical protein